MSSVGSGSKATITALQKSPAVGHSEVTAEADEGPAPMEEVGTTTLYRSWHERCCSSQLSLVVVLRGCLATARSASEEPAVLRATGRFVNLWRNPDTLWIRMIKFVYHSIS